MTRTPLLALFVLHLAGSMRAQDAPLGAVGRAAHTAQVPAEEGDAVLSIDGESISAREFGMWLIQTQGEKMARQFAEDYFAVDQEAARLGIELTDDEILRAVQADLDVRVAHAFLGSKSDWIKEVERTGHTESGILRQRLVEYRPRLIAKKIASIDRVVPEAKIVREWQRLYGRNGKKYDVQMIKFKPVVTTPLTSSREVWNAERDLRMKEQKERALAVRARAVAGEDFGKLAREFSADPDTRDHDGKPSGGFSHGGWPGSFLDELEKLGPGDLSQPIFGRGGYWLIKVLAVKETPLESVREKLHADLVERGPEEDEVGAVLARIKQDVDVKILPTLYSEQEGSEWPSAYEPALEIDGEQVRRGTYARWIRDTLGETFVPLFVQERAVRRAAREQGITVTEAEVEARTRDNLQYLVDNGHGGSRDTWLRYLQIGGRDEDSFVRQLTWRTRMSLLAEKMLLRERKVTSADLQRHFVQQYGEAGRRLDVSLILVNSKLTNLEEGLSREELDVRMQAAVVVSRARATELVARIRGGETFAEVAKSESDDERTRDQGGAFPGRFRADRFSDDVAAVVERLAPGEISEPIAYGNQWLIFRVDRIRQVTFDEVKDELHAELMNERPTDVEITGYQNSIAKKSAYKILPGMSR
ncbi:MAG: peptidylprolyl isomerase [Planctomycetota bacterium]